MDFALNEEQLELQEMVRDFVEKELKEGTLIEVPVGFLFPRREIGFVCRQKDVESSLIAPFFHNAADIDFS